VKGKRPRDDRAAPSYAKIMTEEIGTAKPPVKRTEKLWVAAGKMGVVNKFKIGGLLVRTEPARKFFAVRERINVLEPACNRDKQ
jgi:hypothetical protein